MFVVVVVVIVVVVVVVVVVIVVVVFSFFLLCGRQTKTSLNAPAYSGRGHNNVSFYFRAPILSVIAVCRPSATVVLII